MLPMPWRLRAFVVNDADGQEEHRNRDQQEAHGQQAGAGNAPAIVAVIPAPTARIVRAMIARAASIGTAGLAFRSFESGRHILKIPTHGMKEECLKSAGDSLAAPSSFWARSRAAFGAPTPRESTRPCARPCSSTKSRWRLRWPAQLARRHTPGP